MGCAPGRRLLHPIPHGSLLFSVFLNHLENYASNEVKMSKFNVLKMQ